MPIIREDETEKLLAFVDLAVPGGCNEVWLAGSRARGDARPDSDWDVVAFTPYGDPRSEKLFCSNQLGNMPEGTVIQLVIAHPNHWSDPRPYMVGVRDYGIRLR